MPTAYRHTSWDQNLFIVIFKKWRICAPFLHTSFGCWWHVKNNWVSPRKISGVMKWKSTVESSGLLGATAIDLKELLRPRICGMCTKGTRYWTNTHIVTRSLSFRKAGVCGGVCVYVQRHILTCSLLESFFLHVRLIRDERATWIRIKKEPPYGKIRISSPELLRTSMFSGSRIRWVLTFETVSAYLDICVLYYRASNKG